MRTTSRSVALAGARRALVLAGSLLSMAGPARAAEQQGGGEGVPAALLTGIEVSFRLDPRLTRGLYMGDRWVSPTTYSRVEDGEQLVVEARAFGVLRSRARPVRVDATWTPADPEILSVSPRQGHEVTLTVRRAGKTHVTVSYGPVARKLTVDAVEERGLRQVHISPAPEGEDDQTAAARSLAGAGGE